MEVFGGKRVEHPKWWGGDGITQMRASEGKWMFGEWRSSQSCNVLFPIHQVIAEAVSRGNITVVVFNGTMWGDSIALYFLADLSLTAEGSNMGIMPGIFTAPFGSALAPTGLDGDDSLESKEGDEEEGDAEDEAA